MSETIKNAASPKRRSELREIEVKNELNLMNKPKKELAKVKKNIISILKSFLTKQLSENTVGLLFEKSVDVDTFIVENYKNMEVDIPYEVSATFKLQKMFVEKMFEQSNIFNKLYTFYGIAIFVDDDISLISKDINDNYYFDRIVDFPVEEIVNLYTYLVNNTAIMRYGVKDAVEQFSKLD